MQDSQWGLTRVEQRGRIPSPRPARHTSLDAAQGTVGLLSYHNMVPGLVELVGTLEGPPWDNPLHFASGQQLVGRRGPTLHHSICRIFIQ